MKFPLACLVIAGGASVAAGVRAWQAGRFADAHSAFAGAEESAGAAAPAALIYDRGLAALHAGDARDAESAARRAAGRGGAAFAAPCAFLAGCAALERCAVAEARAREPEADPAAWDEALSLAHSARRDFAAALFAAEEDWPQARRNLERALLAEARIARARVATTRAEPSKKDEVRSEVSQSLPELTPEQIAQMLERMDAQRARLRGARGTGTGSGGAVQDW